MFIGCIFKFVNLLYGAYPEFNHSIFFLSCFRYDAKRKRHVLIKPTTGFVAKAVGKFYTDLSSVSNKDPQFEKVVKLASRCYNDIADLCDPVLCLAKKTRASGAGRKPKDPEIRETFFFLIY